MTGDAECLFMCPLTMSSPLLIFIFVAKVSGGRAISEEIWDPFNVEKKKNREMNTAQKKSGCVTLPTVK